MLLYSVLIRVAILIVRVNMCCTKRALMKNSAAKATLYKYVKLFLLFTFLSISSQSTSTFRITEIFKVVFKNEVEWKINNTNLVV